MTTLVERLNELREKATAFDAACAKNPDDDYELWTSDPNARAWGDIADLCARNLDTIISALVSSEEGMVMVPREPTEEMLKAAHFEQISPFSIYANNRDRALGVYRAMIAAAPTSIKEV